MLIHGKTCSFLPRINEICGFVGLSESNAKDGFVFITIIIMLPLSRKLNWCVWYRWKWEIFPLSAYREHSLYACLLDRLFCSGRHREPALRPSSLGRSPLCSVSCKSSKFTSVYQLVDPILLRFSFHSLRLFFFHLTTSFPLYSFPERMCLLSRSVTMSVKLVRIFISTVWPFG